MKNLKVVALGAALITAGFLTAGLMSCDKLKSLKGGSLKNDEAKYSYAIGYQFAKNMKDQEVTVDAQALAMAIEDVMANKPTQLTEEEMQGAMKSMYEKRKEKEGVAAVENKKKGDAYLEANKTKEGVKVTATGLQYQVVEEGSGENPKAESLVSVHYKGTLIDGKEFDSSFGRGQPAKFPVNGVIPGWQEALKLMKKGAKWKLFVPPELAYGDRARPGIPANSVLVFDVELLDIQSAADDAKKTPTPKMETHGKEKDKKGKKEHK